MTELISESRFYMWRTVVALAHADHKVTPEEREFVDNYLDKVPFSPEQKEVLMDDLDTAQDPSVMFNNVTDPADQGEFFQFARMMVWCDGDFDAQEEKIFDFLKDTQMGRVNPAVLEEMVRETRSAFNIERLKEDAEFQQEAKGLAGIGNLLNALKRNTKSESL